MAVAVLAGGMSQAFAAVVSGSAFFPVPSLDEAGLLGLTVVVAIAGGIAARRRKRK